MPFHFTAYYSPFIRSNCLLYHSIQNLAHNYTKFIFEIERFKTALDVTEHRKGSSIFTSYAYCEDLISKYQEQLNLKEYVIPDIFKRPKVLRNEEKYATNIGSK